jgi:hypothetical protein
MWFLKITIIKSDILNKYLKRININFKKIYMNKTFVSHWSSNYNTLCFYFLKQQRSMWFVKIAIIKLDILNK